MDFGPKSWGRLRRGVILLAGICLFSLRVDARELSFEQRVQAEQAIQRVYYSHQIGATRPFDEAVTRTILEKKVRTYLKQSAALDQIWKTPITAPMLRAEVARMQRQSRMPERLRELFAALSDDPFLIQECLARPALAARLAGNFFAFDQQIHGGTRHLAESARADPAARKSLVVVEERDDFVLRERPQGSNAADSRSSSPAVRRFPRINMEAWWSKVEGGLHAEVAQTVGEDGSGDVYPIAYEPAVAVLRIIPGTTACWTISPMADRFRPPSGRERSCWFGAAMGRERVHPS